MKNDDLVSRLAGALTEAELRLMLALKLPPAPPPLPAPIRIAGVKHEYSTIDPWNADCSLMLLFQGHGAVGLYNGNDGAFLSSLPKLNSSSEPRWSRTDPKLLYYVSGNSLLQYDVKSAAVRPLRTFTEYIPFDSQQRNGIRMMGEQDLSDNGQFVALCGMVSENLFEVFRYDLLNDIKGPAQRLAGIDNLYMTPDNSILVGFVSGGSSRFQGIELYDPQMRFVRQVTTRFQHMDACRNQDGEECILWSRGDDKHGPTLIRLRDGQSTMLFALDWSLATHISCPIGRTWGLVTTYDPKNANSAISFANEILKVSFDGKVVSLGKHGSNANVYETQPKASVSHDGSRYVYTSNADSVICRL